MSAFNFSRQEAEVVLSALRVKIAQQISLVGIADGYTVAVAEDIERLLEAEAAKAAKAAEAAEAAEIANEEEAPVEEVPAEEPAAE